MLARDRLAAACDRHAQRLGRRPAALVLRDTRSRWGSCSAQGVLMFSWRLAMAPPAVLDYVAAHEVAHLAEMNHSRAFWATVARLLPDHAAPRAWLRAEGGALHRWRFDALPPRGD
jgi:predicted metal-dependent hydrolase